MHSSAREQWVLDQFMLGLGNRELQKHVQFGHPRDLNEAISLATEYVAFESRDLKKTISKPGDIYAVSTANHPQATPGSDNRSVRNNSQSSDKKSKETRACHHCGKAGHLIKDCRALKQKQELELRNGYYNQQNGYYSQRKWQSPQPNFDSGYWSQQAPVNTSTQLSTFPSNPQGN